MAYNKLLPDSEAKIKQFPERLQTLAWDIYHQCKSELHGSFHDTTCDMLECGELKAFSDAEIRQVLEAMGSHWDD